MDLKYTPRKEDMAAGPSEPQAYYPSLYLHGEVAKGLLPAGADVGQEFQFVGKVRLAGMSKHKNGEASCDLEFISGELSEAAKPEKSQVDKIYGE